MEPDRRAGGSASPPVESVETRTGRDPVLAGFPATGAGSRAQSGRGAPPRAPALGFTGRLAVWSGRWRWAVIALWLAAIIAISAAGQIAGGVFTDVIEFTSEPESQSVKNLLDRYRGSEPIFEQVIVRSDTYTVDDPQFRALVDDLTAALRTRSDAVVPNQVFSYYETGSPDLVSADGHTTIVPALLVGDLDQAKGNLEVFRELIAPFRTAPSFEVLHGGAASISEAFVRAAEDDASAELKVLPVALIVLVLVFGAVVAAIVPMGIALVSIAVAVGAATLISQFWALSAFVTNIITMLGLAVGIDYALFIIARFREQRGLGYSRLDSIGIAGDAASRAVFFSGLTVMIGLTGMLLVPSSVFRSFGIGASLVVFLAVTASLTLLPALLSLLGDNVNRVRPRLLFIFLLAGGIGAAAGAAVAGVTELTDRAAVPAGALLLGLPATVVLARVIDRRGGMRMPVVRKRAHGGGAGFWDASARFVMARPLVMALSSAGLLVLLAIPYASITLGIGAVGSMPERFEARRAFEILDEEFSAGRLSPTEIAVRADDVHGPAVVAATERAMSLIAADPEIAVTAPVEAMPDGRVAFFTVALPGDSAGSEALRGVERLREEILPAAFAGVDAEPMVGGMTALAFDFFDVVDRYTPIVFAFVLGFAFVLLLLIFRSVVIPLKAIVMNLLSVAASYGVVVAVFQWGWGADLLGFTRVEAVEAWLPLLMFSILFGLSMDYHIFLLSRIRERFDETHDNAESVAHGLRQTAGIITGAAAIMVAVFGGFALGELPMMQQLGVGLAVSVFLDATIVRTVLVPSSMRLLGDVNWYLPSWLEWMPDLRVERDPSPAAAAPTAPPAETLAAG